MLISESLFVFFGLTISRENLIFDRTDWILIGTEMRDLKFTYFNYSFYDVR